MRTRRKVWRACGPLHAGDREPSHNPALVQAWIAFHAGEFEHAARIGLDVGVPGYAVAHKAICIYAQYLEPNDEEAGHLRMRGRALRAPAAGAARQSGRLLLARLCAGPVFAGHLGGQGAGAGLGAKVRSSLETTLTLAPQRADAQVALGIYHAEILDKVGALAA
jgi:hypothetical protein